MEDPDLLTEVPDVLKRLARVVARAFYTNVDVVVVDALVHHTCVKEEDLIELLYLERRIVSRAVVSLKKDKLVKTMTRSEVTGPDGKTHKYSYHFINYRSFVNVVKYKLDKMREKIENEEKMAKHRQFYQCPRCGSAYGDLDVIHLFDQMDGNLKCSHCREVLVEDESRANPVNAKSTVSRLNEVTRPIVELIRQTENMRLAPEVLEPEPTTILHLKNRMLRSNRSAQLLPGQEAWAESRAGGLDMFKQGVNIDFASGQSDLQDRSRVSAKEQPVWLAKSTVEPLANEPADKSSQTGARAMLDNSAAESVKPFDASKRVKSGSKTARRHFDDNIMADLMAYEKAPKKSKLDVPGASLAGQHSSSDDEASTSEEEVDAQPLVLGSKRPAPGEVAVAAALSIQQSQAPLTEEVNIEDDEDEEVTLKVGERTVALSDVTDEMIEEMTAEERETYERLAREAAEDFF